MDAYDHFVLSNLNLFAYALIDIEAIALRKGRSYPLPGKKAGIHNCTRKIAVLLRNGNSLVQEFTPCIRFRQLSGIERKMFLWCQTNVHHLQYYPSRNSNSCANAPTVVEDFLLKNGIEVCLYKGGVLEKDFCDAIGFSAINIEYCGVKPASCHEPQLELEYYYKTLKELKYL